MLEILNPEVVRKIYSNIETELNADFYMKDEFLRRYSINYENLRDIVKSRN